MMPQVSSFYIYTIYACVCISPSSLANINKQAQSKGTLFHDYIKNQKPGIPVTVSLVAGTELQPKLRNKKKTKSK